MAMIPRLTGMAIGASMVLALAACGSTATTSSSSGGSGGSGTGPAESISVQAQDYQFSPTALTASANTTVKVIVKNSGTKQHNLTIKELGVNQDLAVGSTQTVTFTTKGAASLVYYCEYHRDSKGMRGTLTVGGGAVGASGSPAPAPAATSSGTSTPIY